MKKILNERLEAEKILNSKDEVKYKKSILILIGKYYTWYENLNVSEVTYKLIDFCEHRIIGFSKNMRYDEIEKISKYCSKHILKEINDIEISKSEVEYFVNLDYEYIYKKFLFGLYCWYLINLKYDTYPNIFRSNNDYKDFKNSMNFDAKLSAYSILPTFVDDGWIRSCNSGNIDLLFVGKVPIDNDKITLNHLEENQIGLFFDKWCGDKKVGVCRICGKFIKKRSNYQPYCNKCSRDKQLEAQIKYNKKRI